MIYINTNKIKFIGDKGKYHRDDGPAFIVRDYQIWHKHGKRHRLDGPAFINGDCQSWWIEGKIYSKFDFENKIKEMGLV